MKFQDDISNMNTYVRTYVRTYGQAETNMPPHFFKVEGIKNGESPVRASKSVVPHNFYYFSSQDEPWSQSPLW